MACLRHLPRTFNWPSLILREYACSTSSKMKSWRVWLLLSSWGANNLMPCWLNPHNLQTRCLNSSERAFALCQSSSVQPSERLFIPSSVWQSRLIPRSVFFSTQRSRTTRRHLIVWSKSRWKIYSESNPSSWLLQMQKLSMMGMATVTNKEVILSKKKVSLRVSFSYWKRLARLQKAWKRTQDLKSLRYSTSLLRSIWTFIRVARRPNRVSRKATKRSGKT